MADTLGIVTEQGDLGLGFNELSEEEQEALNEANADEE